MSITKLEHKVTVPTGGSDGSRRLRVVHGRQQVNLPAAERAVRDLLLALGRNPSSPHLTECRTKSPSPLEPPPAFCR